jgi:hypothetical protein
MNAQPQIKDSAVGVVTSLIDLLASGDKHLADPASMYLTEAQNSFQDAMLLMQGYAI